jgi:LuxR family maltose regulon positive regulatory protein
MRSETMEPAAEAFMAMLDLRHGRPAAALRWARAADPDALGARYPMFFEPGAALVEVLLASESESDTGRGRALLDRYYELAERLHQHPQTLRLLGLRALDLAARDDEAGALESLCTAVTMSQRSGMIRRLADLGPPLAPLLHRLDVTGNVLAHVGAILAALEPPDATETDAPSGAVRAVDRVAGEPALTSRELDVLVRLADRKSNKEIARELLIAPATVKKHTITLYDKLNVHRRQEAVAKARTLGYLPD